MSTVQEEQVVREEEIDVPTSRVGEPTWEIAQFFPRQGHWSEEEYLALDTKQLVEFVDGKLEFRLSPTTSHQRLSGLLFHQLHECTTERTLPPPFSLHSKSGSVLI